MATKHNIEVKVFVDGKEYIKIMNISDSNPFNGVVTDPRILENKDKTYIHKILSKQSKYLIKFSLGVIKAFESKEQKSHSMNNVTVRTEPVNSYSYFALSCPRCQCNFEYYQN